MKLFRFLIYSIASLLLTSCFENGSSFSKLVAPPSPEAFTGETDSQPKDGSMSLLPGSEYAELQSFDPAISSGAPAEVIPPVVNVPGVFPVPVITPIIENTPSVIVNAPVAEVTSPPVAMTTPIAGGTPIASSTPPPQSTPPPTDPIAPRDEDTVCNPLASQSASLLSDDHGLVGELTDYRAMVAQHNFDSAYIWSLTNAKIDAGASAFTDLRLYFNDVNLAPRRWEDGFLNKEGAQLTSGGTAVVEYFKVKLQSDFRLTAGEPDGEYEFSFISDDGILVTMGNMVINDDSVHAPRRSPIGTIQLEAGRAYPLIVAYFQGPRVEIALQMFMRLKGTTEWLTVSADHFFLPEGRLNPCAVAGL